MTHHRRMSLFSWALPLAASLLFAATASATKTAAPPLKGDAGLAAEERSLLEDTYFGELSRLLPDRSARKVGLDLVAMGQDVHKQPCTEADASCYCPITETGCWIDLAVAAVVDTLVVAAVETPKDGPAKFQVLYLRHLQSERSTVQVRQATESLDPNNASYSMRKVLTQLIAPERYQGILEVEAPADAMLLVDGAPTEHEGPLPLPCGTHTVEVRVGDKAHIESVEIRFEQTAVVTVAPESGLQLGPITLTGITLVGAGAILTVASLGTMGIIGAQGRTASQTGTIAADGVGDLTRLLFWRAGLVGAGVGAVLILGGASAIAVEQGME